MPEQPSAEDVLTELTKYKDLGVPSYVLPSVPLGEQWIVGVQGQIVRLNGEVEVAAFLVGMSAVAHFMASRTPGFRP
jgi:hypothetical protein